MIIKNQNPSRCVEYIEETYGVKIELSRGSKRHELGQYQVVVCDYRMLTGYTFRFAVAIYKGEHAHLVERINIK